MNKVEPGVISFDKNLCDGDFFAMIGKVLEILTSQGYKCLFYYEDCDIYVLQYATTEDWGEGDFQFITPDEWENILFDREENKDEN